MLMNVGAFSSRHARDLGWSLLAAGGVAAFFLTVDGAFFLANLTKIAEGGYVPLILAIAVYSVMWIWHRGAAAVSMPHARGVDSGS